MRRGRVGPVLLVTLPVACSAAPPPWLDAPPSRPEPSGRDGGEESPSISRSVSEPTCAADADCGYDAAHARCLADPRANRQPPLVDQGVVCYCEGGRCDALRVAPVPCESDASCAVRADPRPHPVAADRAADAAHSHEQGRPCRDSIFSTTCERTNICTMHRLPCPRP